VGQRLSTRAAVTAYLDALNAHDPDRIAACVAPDFVNEHTAVGAVSRTGRAEYRAALDGFLGSFADLHYEAEQVLVDGSGCAVPYRMTARLDGLPLDIRGVFVFAVDEDGLIIRRTDYWDSGQVPRLS
jgi:ketosteroid isomerase-like protein